MFNAIVIICALSFEPLVSSTAIVLSDPIVLF